MVIKSLLNSLQNHLLGPQAYAEKLGVKMGVGCPISAKEFPHEGSLIELGNCKYYNDPKLDQFGN